MFVTITVNYRIFSMYFVCYLLCMVAELLLTARVDGMLFAANFACLLAKLTIHNIKIIFQNVLSVQILSAYTHLYFPCLVLSL